jgi:Flp pilus assembly protein TadD
MAAMLDSIEKILANIVAQPVAKTEADLQALAQSHATNPLPLLALTIVTGFSQPERFSQAEATLKKAQGLITAANDPEMTFARALAAVASAQLGLLAAQTNPIGRLTAAEIQAIQKEQKQEAAAIASLKAAAATNSSSALAQTVTSMLLAFSLNASTAKTDHAAGVAQLTKFQAQGASQHLAAFFLIYAHRRAGEYPQALGVAQKLEQAHPNSSLVKKVIGSCYFFSNDLTNAEKFYRQALALDSKDPSIHLGLAQISVQKGDKAAAQQFLASTTQHDTAGHLALIVNRLHQTLTLQTPVP